MDITLHGNRRMKGRKWTLDRAPRVSNDVIKDLFEVTILIRVGKHSLGVKELLRRCNWLD